MRELVPAKADDVLQAQQKALLELLGRLYDKAWDKLWLHKVVR